MLVAFDLDGTLEDSRADMVLAIQNLRQELGLVYRSYDELLPWVSQGMPVLYANAFDDAQSPHIPEYYARHYAGVIANQTRLYDGILEMLQALKPLCTLAVVTNKPEDLSQLLLEKLQIAAYFSAVIGGDSFRKAKPDPMMLDGALQRSRATHPVIMVGDSAGDVKMAKSFGAGSIWCSWGYLDREPSEKANTVVHHPSEVVKYIQSLLR